MGFYDWWMSEASEIIIRVNTIKIWGYSRPCACLGMYMYLHPRIFVYTKLMVS